VQNGHEQKKKHVSLVFDKKLGVGVREQREESKKKVFEGGGLSVLHPGENASEDAGWVTKKGSLSEKRGCSRELSLSKPATSYGRGAFCKASVIKRGWAQKRKNQG